MKRFLFYLILFLPLVSIAQTKERRVYYLDCTYTMKNPNNVWNKVRDNLKKAINNVNDETTELIVIPFWNKNTTLTPYKRLATEQGKKELSEIIDDTLNCPKRSYTLLSIPLSDFYNNRVSTNADCITYMFFMTDGENEDEEELKKFGKVRFYDCLKTWGERYGDKQVYGFYVMLTESAKSKKVEDLINKQSHLWKVETADINIDILRLETEVIFNVRNDKFVDIPASGNVKGVTFETQFANNEYYQITKNEIVGNILRVYIVPTSGQNLSTLPDEVKVDMNVSMKSADDFTFLVTDKVKIICKNEKEYSLKVSVR